MGGGGTVIFSIDNLWFQDGATLTIFCNFSKMQCLAKKKKKKKKKKGKKKKKKKKKKRKERNKEKKRKQNGLFR